MGVLRCRCWIYLVDDFAKGFLQFTMYGGKLLGVAVGLVDGDKHLVHLVDRLVHPCLKRRTEGGGGGGDTRWVPVANEGHLHNSTHTARSCGTGVLNCYAASNYSCCGLTHSVIWDLAVLLHNSRTCVGRRHRFWAGHQKP